MEFFIDSADVKSIVRLNNIGLVDGVTTNPSIISRSGLNFKEVIADICEAIDGPVSAEVMGDTAEEMIKEGRELCKIAENVCVKLPLTMDGLRACNVLSKDNISTNVTLCFSPGQALLAAKVGATFISPFIGRLDDISLDGMQLIHDIRTIYDNYGFNTKILAASIRSVAHVKECGLAGADVITAPPAVIDKLVDHPLTDKGLEVFLQDWKKSGNSIL